VHLHPVIDQTIQNNPVGPLAALIYVAVLLAAATITMRRPIGGVCMLVFLQPFAFYRDVLGTTVTLPKVALVGVILGCLAYPNALNVLRERVPMRILLAGALVLAATALSIVHATHIHAWIRELLKTLEYLVLFATVYVAYRLEPNRDMVRLTVIVVTTMVALASLSQEVFGAPSGLWINGHPTPRIAGPLEGPNQLAGYLELSIPLLFAFCIERFDATIGIALVLAVFADVLTFSRTGAIAAVIALAIVAYIFRNRNQRAALLCVGGGIVAGSMVAVFWGIVAHTHGINRFWTFKESPNAGGVGTRSQLWPAAIRLWRSHPLLGVGAGNYELDLPLVGLYTIRTHANSLYLQALAEGGIVQLAATLYLAYVSISTFVRERAQSPIVAGVLAGSVALALHQIADYLVYYPKIGGWWWVLLALGAAEVARAAEPARPERTVPQCA
jgi:O-antigen ligase